MSKQHLINKLEAKKALRTDAQQHLDKLNADLKLITSFMAEPITKQIVEVRNQLSMFEDEIYILERQVEDYDAPPASIKDVRGMGGSYDF